MTTRIPRVASTRGINNWHSSLVL